MKKVICVFLTVLLIISNLPVTMAVGENQIYLSYYSTPNANILANSICQLTFGIVGNTVDPENGRGMVTISVSDSSSFKLTGGDIIKDVEVINGVTAPLSFSYDGKSKNLNITVSDPSTGATNTQTIYIAEATLDSQSGGSDTESEPILTVSGSAQTLMPGQPGSISVTITNNSRFPANNIYCTLKTDGNSIYPSSLSSRFLIGNVAAGASNVFTIPVTVTAGAANGYKSMNLKFDYDNGMGKSFEHSEDIGVTIGNSAIGTQIANINVLSANLDKKVIGGDNTANLTVELQNSGEWEATNVEVSLEGYTAKGFTLNDAIGIRRFASIQSNGRIYASFPLKISPELESGSHSMKVKMTYNNGKEVKTVSEEIFINVRRNPSGGVEISSAKLNTNKPGTSNKVKLTVGIVNRDTSPITNVRTYIDGLSTATFTLDGTFGSKNVAVMNAGSSAVLEFPLYVSKSLATGNYPLKVVTKYIDASGAEKSSETEVYLYINRPENSTGTPDNLPASTPRVIISKYSVNTDLIEAGKEFTFDFSLKNTSKTSEIKNLKIVISSADGVFLPVEGSSSFFKEGIEAGSEADFSIKLMPKRDADTKTYPLTITIDYENEKNAPFTVAEILSFSVNQKQRIELNNLNYMPNGMNSSTVSMQYVNKGKAILYNLSIRVEGPFKSENGSQYIGNLGIGSADFFEDYITPTEAGELKGKVIVEYEDVNGKKTEVEKEFTANVQEMTPDMGGDMGTIDGGMTPPIDESAQKPATNWIVIGIIAGVVLIAGGVAVFIIIKRKRRKMAEMTADE